MESLIDEALPHTEIPNANRAIAMSYWTDSFYAISLTSWVETNFIHLTKFGSIHLVNRLVGSNIPNLNDLIHTDRNGETTISSRFYWINIAVVARKVSHVLTSQCIPDFYRIFIESTRKKHPFILWIKANGPDNTFVTWKIHFLGLLLLIIL